MDSKTTGIAYSTGSPYNSGYFEGNYYDGKQPENQWELVKFRDSWTTKQISNYKKSRPFETSIVGIEDAKTAYKQVLEHGGASLPKRDAVDQRLVEDVKTRSGKIIKSQEDVGGWPILISAPAPKDTDRDGMPDKWEKKNALNPNNADDGNKVGKDGYTMLEKYLNSIK